MSADSRKPHSVLLLSRGGPDVRAQKEAHTLAAMGWRVSVIAWDRARELPQHTCEFAPEPLARMLDDWNGRSTNAPGLVTVTHLRIAAGYGTGRRLLLAIPRFWARLWGELRRLRPDVVHAHDLDTLPVAVAYGRWAGVPVLYDAREYYPGMVRDNLGARFSRALDVLDRWLATHVDGVITVGERLAQRYRDLGVPTWIVHNSQPLPDAEMLDSRCHAKRHELGVPDDALLVVYVGYLNPDRVIMPLLEAVPDVEPVWCVVAGTGPQLDAVKAAAKVCDRIRVLGWVPLGDVMDLVLASDAVYYGLDAANPNSKYFMPNSAFFALAAGRPVITTPVGEIAEVLAHTGAGLILEDGTREAARSALRQLCDMTTRDSLTSCARSVGRTRYHWGMAADELYTAYQHMGNVKNCK